MTRRDTCPHNLFLAQNACMHKNCSQGTTARFLRSYSMVPMWYLMWCLWLLHCSQGTTAWLLCGVHVVSQVVSMVAPLFLGNNSMVALWCPCGISHAVCGCSIVPREQQHGCSVFAPWCPCDISHSVHGCSVVPGEQQHGCSVVSMWCITWCPWLLHHSQGTTASFPHHSPVIPHHSPIIPHCSLLFPIIPLLFPVVPHCSPSLTNGEWPCCYLFCQISLQSHVTTSQPIRRLNSLKSPLVPFIPLFNMSRGGPRLRSSLLLWRHWQSWHFPDPHHRMWTS